MSFYSELAQDALSVLAEFGAVGILRRTGSDAYDPFDASTLVDTPVDEAVTLVVLDVKEPAMPGSEIQRSQKRAFMSAVGVAPPKVGDQIVWVDGTYTIVDPMNLAPNGESVLYSLQVRK